MDLPQEKKQELLRSLKEFLEEKCHDEKSSFDATVFLSLYRQFLEENPYIDWNSWKHVTTNKDHKDLPEFDKSRRDILDRLVVIKLNGGLGTTMGCSGPKSFIKAKGDLSFLDIAIKQHEKFNSDNNCSVPLFLMNSFYTHEATMEMLKDHPEVRCFEQSKCPRIYSDTLLPMEENSEDEEWYPPGHGNIFQSLAFSGVLDKLLSQGRDIIFVSNIDNTGATLDLKIAQCFSEGAEYLMECTEKTENDKKGGTLIDIGGQLMHLEMPQVPPEHLEDFCSTNIFKTFNTNNIWVNLRAVKERLTTIKSEIIVNKKKLKSGREIIQLETSIGGCIKNFPKAYSVHVSRDRFLPVKKTDDLLAISSDLYSLNDDFSLRLSSTKQLEENGEVGKRTVAPMVSLGQYFQTVSDFHDRFEEYPKIELLRSLTIEGDVKFEKGVTLEGAVTIINKNKEQAVIRSGTVLRETVLYI